MDDFKDAENDTVEDDEDDDYFQNEDLEEKQKKSPEEKQTEEIRDFLEETKVEGTLKNSARPLSEMAFILPALQNHGYDSDEDDNDNDNESLKDPREIQEEKKPFEENEKEEVTKSVEPQAIQPAAAPILPVELKPVSSEKPTTYEPIPDEKEATKEIPTKKLHEMHAIYTPMLVPEHKQDSTQEDAEAVTSVPEIKDSDLSPVKQPVTDTQKADPDSGIPDNGTIDSEVVDSGVSSSSPPVEKQTNRLANILPAVEESFKHITSASDLKKSLEEQLPARDKERASRSREFEYSIEDPIDLDLFRDNVIAIQSIDPKDIPVNDLKPRQQEEAGK